MYSAVHIIYIVQPSLTKDHHDSFVLTSTGCVYGTRTYKQVAIIARTNLGLFEEMAKVVRTPEGKKKKLGFVGVRGWLKMAYEYNYIILYTCV